MGRVYAVVADNQSVAGAITLLQLKAGASVTCEILRAAVSQSASTTSAQQRIQVLRKTAAATVTSFTPRAHDAGDAAAGSAGGTAATGILATAEGTDGNIIIDDVFNVLTGYLYLPVPEERIWLGAAAILGVKFPTSWTNTGVNGELIFREYGG